MSSVASPYLIHIRDPTWKFLFPYKTVYMNVGINIGRNSGTWDIQYITGIDTDLHKKYLCSSYEKWIIRSSHNFDPSSCNISFKAYTSVWINDLEKWEPCESHHLFLGMAGCKTLLSCSTVKSVHLFTAMKQKIHCIQIWFSEKISKLTR